MGFVGVRLCSPCLTSAPTRRPLPAAIVIEVIGQGIPLCHGSKLLAPEFASADKFPAEAAKIDLMIILRRLFCYLGKAIFLINPSGVLAKRGLPAFWRGATSLVGCRNGPARARLASSSCSAIAKWRHEKFLFTRPPCVERLGGNWLCICVQGREGHILSLLKFASIDHRGFLIKTRSAAAPLI